MLLLEIINKEIVHIESFFLVIFNVVSVLFFAAVFNLFSYIFVSLNLPSS